MTGRRARGRALAALGALALATACTTPGPGPDGRVNRDPYERSNRVVFRFNDGVDRFVIDPIAEGWAFVTPRFFRVGLDKLLTNLRFPLRFLTTLGQGEPLAAGEELARFVVNTSVGIAGFFDPASRLGLRFYDEDFGQMFGRWGIPSGPYWVLPFLGPSTPRDAWGYLFDSATNVVPGVGVVTLVNGRAIADAQVDLARVAALDLYVFVRDGYLQRREAQVRNLDRKGVYASQESDGEANDDDALYELDDSLYEMDDELAEEAAPPDATGEAPNAPAGEGAAAAPGAGEGSDAAEAAPPADPAPKAGTPDRAPDAVDAGTRVDDTPAQVPRVGPGSAPFGAPSDVEAPEELL